MSQKREKMLIKNIMLFAIGSFGPKMLSFFLVPLYTSYLTTEMYGMADMITTIVSLITPILTLDISDAITRFTVDNPTSNEPFAFGMCIYVKSCIVASIIGILICLIKRDKILLICVIFVVMIYLLSAFYFNLLAYLRGTNQVSIIVLAGVINTFVTIILNIVLIVRFKLGMVGYLLAIVGGYVTCNCYICIQIGIVKKLYVKNVDDKLRREMVKYSFPLIFSGIAWWVNGYLDRFFLSFFCGLAANGIYSVANKIPSILSACHSIIYQALQLNAYQEVNAKDSKIYFNKIYDVYNGIMVLVCSSLIMFDKVLAGFLFKGEFFSAWRYAPALLISVVLLSVAGYIETILSAERETKSLARSTFSGAIVNTVLNIVLIQKLQIYGAVIATMLGYFVVWLMRVLEVRKKFNYLFNIRKSILNYIFLTVQYLIVLHNNSYLLHLIVIAILIINNKTSIKYCINLMLKNVRKIKKR